MHIMRKSNPEGVRYVLLQVGYSYVKQDNFVFLANEPGLLLAVFLTIASYSVCQDRAVSCFLSTISI